MSRRSTISSILLLPVTASAPIELDFSTITRDFLDSLSATGEATALTGTRRLLPPDHVWRQDGKARAPMALCEFVAYKTALAYESEAEIRAAVGDAPNVGFFDSSRDGVGDTQGFVFSFDGLVFVILRGTEKGTDWRTNLQHQLTDELRTARRPTLVKELKKRHGARVEPLLDAVAAKRGRHLGFSIGWAAVHEQVLGHIEEHWPPGTPVVVAGHCLGGALALIGALELKRAGHDIAAVVTFGAPQAGNDTFTQEYAAEGLDKRTLLFESKADSVPRLLRRWYYRAHSGARSRLVGLFTPGSEAIPAPKYAVCGSPWIFTAQPALSPDEVKASIKNILDARARRAKEEAERQAREGSQAGTTPTPEADGVPPSSSQPQATVLGQATPDGTGGAAPGQGKESSGSLAAWIIGGIAVLILLLFVWLFVRSKLAAHAIIDRYALFLSTLSYQHIRALRADEPGPAADRLRRANDDLSRYLRFIRGEGAYIAKMTDLPVRLEPDLDLATFLSESKNII